MPNSGEKKAQGATNTSGSTVSIGVLTGFANNWNYLQRCGPTFNISTWAA